MQKLANVSRHILMENEDHGGEWALSAVCICTCPLAEI